MTTVSVELSYEQVLDAVRQLPSDEKIRLLNTIESELSHEEIRRRAIEAVEAIRGANENVDEDELMADINSAVKEVRAERYARGH